MPASYRLGIDGLVEAIRSRPMRSADRLAVAELIASSTNAWYQPRGAGPIFPDGPARPRSSSTSTSRSTRAMAWWPRTPRTGRLIGLVLLPPAADPRLAGHHERAPRTDFGRGVARRCSPRSVDFADRESKPLRLVSSAMNLDSFSLYNRAGFVPRAVYQDMIVNVPEGGLRGRSRRECPAGWLGLAKRPPRIPALRYTAVLCPGHPKQVSHPRARHSRGPAADGAAMAALEMDLAGHPAAEGFRLLPRKQGRLLARFGL